MTLRMAWVGLKEQTFVGSTCTEKKSWPSGQNERVFARLRPVFVVSKVSCQPWSGPAWRLFPGNIHGFSMAIPYATIARVRGQS